MTIDDGAIERLVAAAQQGDPEAFGALFDHYYGPVYRYVAARVGRPVRGSARRSPGSGRSPAGAAAARMH